MTLEDNSVDKHPIVVLYTGRIKKIPQFKNIRQTLNFANFLQHYPSVYYLGSSGSFIT